MMRSSMIDVLRQDYIRTARAKGLSRARVILRHALPNAILPVIAMIGIDIGIFMGGIVVVESVFGWPGIGQLAWQAIQRVDIPIIMGVTLVSACAIVHRATCSPISSRPSSTPASNFAEPRKANRRTNEMKLLASTAVASCALGASGLAQDYTPDPGAPKPGGAITVTYKDDVATLDPAIGYDWQNWSMIKSLFDGLMDYVPGTTTLRPGLAESYEISPDGKGDLHLQAAPGRQVPQRPRDDGRGREILARPRHQPRDPVARRGLLRRHRRALTPRRPARALSGVEGHRCRSTVRRSPSRGPTRPSCTSWR